jgi:hypothetical protein
MDDLPAFDPNDRSHDGDAGFADAISGNAADSAPRTVRRDAAMRPVAGLVGVARTHLFDLAETGKADLVRNIASIAALVREVSTQVEHVGIEPFAGYARRTSSLVDDLHGSIRDRSVEDLIDDGRDLVRHNPEIAILAATIIGFIGARIIKAQR